MVLVAEFLTGAHGARWTWLADVTSPVAGRWVVSGFAYPLGQKTKPVDVVGLVHHALCLPVSAKTHQPQEE